MQEKKKLYQSFLYWIGNHDIVFYILSFTWGSLTSIIGLLLMIPFLITKRVKTFCGRLYGIFPKCFGSGWGFEMGCFFFVSNDCPDNLYMNSHECGHGLQNIIWGPLMLFVISIPSLIRFWYIRYLYKKSKPNVPDYYSIWFEEQADRWGWDYVYLAHINEHGKKELKKLNEKD